MSDHGCNYKFKAPNHHQESHFPKYIISGIVIFFIILYIMIRGLKAIHIIECLREGTQSSITPFWFACRPKSKAF